jgi:hypothetical protein
MSIHEEHGYENPSLEPFYEGLLLLDGVISARTGCYYKGKRITADNSLGASIDMVLFSQAAGEPLNTETEIRPLVDLAFATIAFTYGLKDAHNPDGSTKSREKFLSDGLDKLEKAGLVPASSNQIITLLEENKALWPEEILPLIRTFKNVSNRPLILHRTKGFEQKI